ncbi:CBN-PSD-1 protein [Aphelenchoides avenae]|nr:CBN-PSD-1 protein [Aphelenchus avenae]
MARILEYLECPQYLRKSLYPIQKALKFAGVLNPLDGMHHLRANDSTVPYREGIVLDKPIKAGHGSLCDVGLEKDLELEDGTTLPPWTRITVRMTTRDTDKRRLRGVVTSPQVVRNESGLYWGYKVRIAKSFSDIFSKKYDVIIGTSERGTPVSDISVPRKEQAKVLVVFGGLDGIEAALESDESVSTSDPSDFFNTYINSLPDQGSRIRLYTSLPLNILSKVAGVISRVELPVGLRKPLYGLYARAYNCRMDEASEEDLKAYPSFAAFFNRSLKGNPGNRLYQLVVYLAPGDYHGFHSPARWKNHNTVHHPGFLLSVRPSVLTWIPNLLCVNERVCLTGAWRHGFFSMSAVAATNVGDIVIDSAPRNTSEVVTGEDHIVYDTHREYKPGDRVGEFRLGSTIVLIFEAPAKLQFSVKAGDTMRYGQSLVVNL